MQTHPRRIPSPCAITVTPLPGAWSRAGLAFGELCLDRLLHLVREHWGSENRVFYVRDTTLGEDGCRVRGGSGPQIFAALRHFTLKAIKRAGWSNKAQAAGHYAANPLQTICLLTPTKD